MVTERQAREIVGDERFDALVKTGFIRPFGLMDLPSELYDRKQVESAPLRFELSHKCFILTRTHKKYTV